MALRVYLKKIIAIFKPNRGGACDSLNLLFSFWFDLGRKKSWEVTLLPFLVKGCCFFSVKCEAMDKLLNFFHFPVQAHARGGVLLPYPELGASAAWAGSPRVVDVG